MGIGPIGTNLLWSLINVIQALFVPNSKTKLLEKKSWFWLFFQGEKNVKSHLEAELDAEAIFVVLVVSFVLLAALSLEKRNLIVGCCCCAVKSVLWCTVRPKG